MTQPHCCRKAKQPDQNRGHQNQPMTAEKLIQESRQARREIQALVSARTSTTAFRMGRLAGYRICSPYPAGRVSPEHLACTWS